MGNSTVDASTIEVDPGTIFPIPYLLFLLGYVIVLLVDRVLVGHYSHNHERISTGGAPCAEHPINPPVCNEHHHSVHQDHIEIPQDIISKLDEEQSPEGKGKKVDGGPMFADEAQESKSQ